MSSDVDHSADGRVWLIPLLFVTLLALMMCALLLGRYPVAPSDIVKAIFSTGFHEKRPYGDANWVIVEIIRIPRVLLVSLCGINLGLAGATMQGLFRNPLVGPEVAGVSAGASFGGALAILLSWPALTVTGSAFAWGFGSMVIVVLLSRASGRSSILALLLSGLIVSAFFGALTEVTEYVADPQGQLPSILYWLLGSFVGATYGKVAVLAGVSLVAATVLLSLRWRINLLSLGETDVRALGVNVEGLRWTILAAVALLVAAQVSVSGGVGFVGLIIPHAARRLVGPEHSRLLPVSGLLGGIYLLIMDSIARTATSTEIPIGVLTSLVGAPIFAFLFWKQQGRGWTRD